MNLKPSFLFIGLAFLFSTAVAQEKFPFIDYETLLTESRKLSDEGNFNNAYKEIIKLNKNDSNYIQSLISKSYYLINDEVRDSTKYNEAIEVTQIGIDSKGANSKYNFFINKAAAYIQLKKYKESISVYDDALKLYPKNTNIFLKKASVYELMKNYEKASEMCKTSIIYSPFNADAHLKLGSLAYKCNNITEALMCFNIYLLIKPDSEKSNKVLNAINTMVSAKYDEKQLDIMVSEDDESFEEIDLIINNHIAISKKYKISTKIKIAIAKQNHLMLEQLKTYEGNDGFYHKHYVPFYNWIRDSKQFDNFIYTICFSSQNDEHKKIISSKIKDIKVFIKKAYNELGENFKENELLFNGKKQQVTCYYNNYTLQSIGQLTNNKMTRYWEVYGFNNANLESKGLLNNEEEKMGEWQWFTEDGKLEEKTNYKDGKLHGSSEYYYRNGNIKYYRTFRDGKLNGDYRVYSKDGALLQKKNFVDGELDGEYREYFDIGEDYLKYIIPYKNDKIEGIVTQFHENGKEALVVTFKDDKKEGLEKEYYKNGKISSEIEYKNGMLDGSYKVYYPNGKLNIIGQSIEGEYNGEWKHYHQNEKPKYEFSYNKGKLVGQYKQYDIDGKVYTIYDYKKNDIYAYSFYDKEGKIIHSADKKSGNLEYKTFNINGTKKSEGIYNYKGGKEGIWKWYSSNGVLERKSTYKENKLIDNTYEYFEDGSERIVKPYNKDTLTGFYVLKHRNGSIDNQGWYDDGLLHGEWRIYYDNRKLKEKNYYYKGKLNGEQISYGANEKIINVTHYEDDILISEDYYNPDGTIYETISIPSKKGQKLEYHYMNQSKKLELSYDYGIRNGAILEYYPNGNKKTEGTYLNSQREGNWKWYYENGKVDTECNYIIGDLDGKRKTYHENGELKEIKQYELGTLINEEKDFTDKGILTSVINYFYGRVHGKRYFYSEDGHLQLIRFYHNGEIIGYSYLDKSKEELPMIPVVNETAKISAYFDNGNKSRVMEINKGVFENQYTEYYYSGQLHQDQVYQNDMLQGEVNTYHLNGKLQKTELYLNNDLKGEVVEYYENGQKKRVAQYAHDELHGKEIKYAKDGKIIKESNYFNGTIIPAN